MIYLDNSATTFPKPSSVYNAIFNASKNFGANPGRSGYTMSRISGNEIDNCRKTAAKMFGLDNYKNVSFTLNCTTALNMVIKGYLKQDDHVVVSCLEHNAVMRPLNKLEEMGIITYTKAKVYPCDDEKTIDSFRKAINKKTALIICTHASNVWGIRLPIERISALGKIYGIPILVDGAQSAGIFPINMKKYDIDFLCLAGHKGLYGPMGTGMLLTNHSDKLDTIIEGGTGTDSMRLCQPKKMPQKFESGTPNLVGICGLNAGMNFVMNKGINNIYNHEMSLILYLYDKLKNLDNVKLYTARPEKGKFAPVLGFNVKGYISDEIGRILDKNKIEVRTGLHCSPSAHEFADSLETGVVRVSPSVFNTKNDIDQLVEVIKNIRQR